MKYRKKPIEQRAFQLVRGVLMPEWLSEGLKRQKAFSTVGEEVMIPTFSGTQAAHTGDWIVEGVDGELYPCPPDVFEATFEAVE